MFRATLALLALLIVTLAGCAASPVDQDTQSAPEAPPGPDQVAGMAPLDPADDMGSVRYWLNGSANITFTDLQVPSLGYHEGGGCRYADAGSLASITSGRLWATWTASTMTEKMGLTFDDRASEFASYDYRSVSAAGPSPLELELESWSGLRNVGFGIEPVSMAPGAELWLVVDQQVVLNWAIEYEGKETVGLSDGNC